MDDPVRRQEAVLDPLIQPRASALGVPDEVIAALHLAGFLNGELRLAFGELERGSLTTQADLLATRIATVDGIYESLWDQLRIVRDGLAKLGRSTAAYDEAFAVLGVVGTKMAVIDANNTFGVGPKLGVGGLQIRVSGEVSVRLNIMGANTALGVTNQFLALLPEVDWSKPPPQKAPRPQVPDLQVIDDGTPAENVRPPRRRGLYAIALIVVGLIGVAVFLGMASRGNERTKDAPQEDAPHTAVTFDELKGMTTVRLTDNVINGRLLNAELQAEAAAELERRYLAELETADLQQVWFRIDAADQLDFGPPVFEAAARRVAALDKPLETLSASLPRGGLSHRFLPRLGAALAPQFQARLPALATVDEALVLFELAFELGNDANNKAAVGAKLAELAARDLVKLETETLELLDGEHVTFGLPQELVDRIEAELAKRPM